VITITITNKIWFRENEYAVCGNSTNIIVVTVFKVDFSGLLTKSLQINYYDQGRVGNPGRKHLRLKAAL